MARYYSRVAVTDGWHVDAAGRYVRDAIRYDCGHNHRSTDAAERCLTKLLDWSKDGKTCSAKWYNATILRTDKDGLHVPETDKERRLNEPAWCPACGANGTDGHLCAACDSKYAAMA